MSEDYPDGYPECGLPLLHDMENGHYDIAHLLLDQGIQSWFAVR